MSGKRYMSIGYIRSNCLSKVACLIDHLPKTQFHISRTQQENKKINTNFPWLTYELVGKREFSIQWSAWRGHSPFQRVLTELTEFKKKRHIDDFTVGLIEVGIDDPKLVELVNAHLAHKFPIDTRFYTSFVNQPLCTDILDGWDASVVREINLNAIVSLHFKRGVLDLKHIKPSCPCEFNIDHLLQEKEIIRQILSHLDTKKWFKFHEVETAVDPKTGQHPWPGVIRTYEQTSGRRWTLVDEEEVR